MKIIITGSHIKALVFRIHSKPQHRRHSVYCLHTVHVVHQPLSIKRSNSKSTCLIVHSSLASDSLVIVVIFSPVKIRQFSDGSSATSDNYGQQCNGNGVPVSAMPRLNRSEWESVLWNKIEVVKNSHSVGFTSVDGHKQLPMHPKTDFTLQRWTQSRDACGQSSPSSG